MIITKWGFKMAAGAGAAICWLIVVTSATLAAETVDLELVIATDVSRSIDGEEAWLQREGIAAAFHSEEVIRAILSGVLGRIGVAYIDFSSPGINRIVMDWRILRDPKSAQALAAELLEAPLNFGQSTSISGAIELAAHMIETNEIEGTRRVIDVSGDGPNNFGRFVDHVRNETVAKRITINGLPIMNERDRFASRYYLPDLDRYYQGCVIGGPGAFIEVARDFGDFARAIRRKLVLEIAGTPRDDRSPAPALVKASTQTPMKVQYTGFVYEKGCDIGERMRRGYGTDPNDP